MSTDNRGSILAMERGQFSGKHGQPVGREARNAFQEPTDFQDPGGEDGCNANGPGGGFDDEWGA
jgi:hypothetical protein